MTSFLAVQSFIHQPALQALDGRQQKVGTILGPCIVLSLICPTARYSGHSSLELNFVTEFINHSSLSPVARRDVVARRGKVKDLGT